MEMIEYEQQDYDAMKELLEKRFIRGEPTEVNISAAKNRYKVRQMSWEFFQKEQEKESKSWIATVEEDTEGELCIVFPPEMIEGLGWKDGDTIDWADNKNGSWTLRKLE
jgi:hypothetical protein